MDEAIYLSSTGTSDSTLHKKLFYLAGASQFRPSRPILSSWVLSARPSNVLQLAILDGLVWYNEIVSDREKVKDAVDIVSCEIVQ